MREYIVSLKDAADLDAFYTDMENLGGTEAIPDRAVDLLVRRPTSRNTHYLLSDEEAEVLKSDPRVYAVTLNPVDAGIIIKPLYTVTGAFDKSATVNVSDFNWALSRCTNGSVSNWGSDLTSIRADVVNVPADGKNVDVVICDGHFDPAHPEFAVNSNGSGGTRVNHFNWFQYSNIINGSLNGTYVYGSYTDAAAISDNNHGCHVAGSVAGNTQGWAQSANIYNISPYSTNPNISTQPSITTYIFDYIRQFHKNKPINPLTGRQNPTVVNCSWESGIYWATDTSLSIYYRGALHAAPLNTTIAETLGFLVFTNGQSYIPAQVLNMDVDIQDAIAEGIIIVAAAGNTYAKIDVSGGLDYDNYFTASGFYGLQYYMRGGTPGSTLGVICVGALDATANEEKTDFSNCGPRIDVFAPGRNILSSVNIAAAYGQEGYGALPDPRNVSYYLAKSNGTSMASPQTAGIVACALETYPHMDQANALAYLNAYAYYNAMYDTGITNYMDPKSLQGATNKVVRYHKERPTLGLSFPKQNVMRRKTSGQVYPRPRIKQ